MIKDIEKFDVTYEFTQSFAELVDAFWLHLKRNLGDNCPTQTVIIEMAVTEFALRIKNGERNGETTRKLIGNYDFNKLK